MTDATWLGMPVRIHNEPYQADFWESFAEILGATVIEEKSCDHGGREQSLVVPIANSDGSICVECGEEF
jgi:hypothetical protein